jgi:hypothetical protein
LGFSSPSRRQHPESTCDELSHAHLCSALSVSHALDGLLLCVPCELVSSHYHVRDSLFRGFSPQPSHRDSSPRCPLLSLTTLASSRVAPTVQLLPSRLQGFDPGCDPLRRAKCLDLLDARSPLEFSLPRAFLRTPGRRLHVLSAHGAGCQFLRVTPAVAFSVSIGIQPALLSLVKLPAKKHGNEFSHSWNPGIGFWNQ